MRVIRTDMYFPTRDVSPLGDQNNVPENPGIGFAYFDLKQLGYTRSDPSETFIIDSAIEDILDNSDSYGLPPTHEGVGAFFACAITGLQAKVTSAQFRAAMRQGMNYNRRISDFVLSADIVIEQSPPSLIDLSTALKNSPTIVLGTYIGLGLADGSYPLMLITMPAGLLIAGAAVGVSKGLENGLNKSIEAWLKQKFK